jgi:ACS family hexuronate transporter-like MFS transporter
MKGSANLWPWAVCAVLLLATLLNYMDRQVLAVSLPTLKTTFHLAEARIGTLEGSFGLAFAAGSLIFGWLADRIGPRFLYPSLLVGWSFAGIATSMAGQPWVTAYGQTVSEPAGTGVFRWMLLCRVLLGFCEAGHWPCALLTVRSVLSSRDRTLGNGILQSGASMGAILVPLYVEAADRAGQSWEFPFYTVGLAGLAWIPLWFIATRSLSLSTSVAVEASASRSGEAMGPFLRRIITLAVIVATITVSWQFLRAWLALYLQDHLHYSKSAARALMSGYFISADVGCLLAGGLVTALVRRGWTTHGSRVVGFCLFSVLTASGALVPWSGTGCLMIALLFITGAGILGLHPFYYALTQEISSSRMGLVSGALAAGGWIVSSLAQIYLGRRIEATQSYELGLLIVGLAPILGLIALILLWPRSSSSIPAHPLTG